LSECSRLVEGVNVFVRLHGYLPLHEHLRRHLCHRIPELHQLVIADIIFDGAEMCQNGCRLSVNPWFRGVVMIIVGAAMVALCKARGG